MKQNFLILGLLVFCFRANAQTVLLNVDRANETKVTDVGPNFKKFTHVIFRFAAVAMEDQPGARIKYGSSLNFALGFRRKYKISPVYSMGYDFEIQYTDYKLKQEQGKMLPDTIINNISGRMDYTAVGLGYYNRFNFDPHRGNFLGTFLDLGIMGLWDFSVKSISKNKLPDGTKEKIIVKNYPFINNLNAKVYARIGFSHASLYGSYRITDLFKTDSPYPDLPRFVFGIELAGF